MERQQTLWPAMGPAGPVAQVWRDLDESDRKRVVAVLARLIGQAVRRDRTERGKEGRHER